MILLVEDNTANREALADLLARDGYAVGTAVNGRQALAKLHHTPAECVVLDLALPVLDGWEFLRLLRADPDRGLASTPVVVTTGSAADDGELAALGACAVLHKPFEVPDLAAAIARCRRPAP